MAIDNDLYNRIAHTWWDENEPLFTLRAGLNPARFGYFKRVLTEVLALPLEGRAALDVGCGGGFLAEEFARLGCKVTGVDPSAPTLETARAHARSSGLSIDYQEGSGEHLPFPDASFDLVYCCDVLEHVRDLAQVIGESARVLKPGGIYLYDTINRTPQSKLVMIKLLQDWKWTAMLPADVHDWKMFITPGELQVLLERNGLQTRQTVGLSPGANPLELVRALRAQKRGQITFAEVGRRMKMRESRDQSVSYMGWAQKGR